MTASRRIAPPSPSGRLKPIKAEPAIKPQMSPVEVIVLREAPKLFHAFTQQETLYHYLLIAIYRDHIPWLRYVLTIDQKRVRYLIHQGGPGLMRRLRKRLDDNAAGVHKARLTVEQRMVIERALEIADRLQGAEVGRWRPVATKASVQGKARS